VPLDAVQQVLFGPATIPVHYYGNVKGQIVGI